ncbi:MAG: CHASE2 domain-containing protein [Jaaginema sp. PMC 1079.18]|nr:CHASE2 domain-containing protein [Jaaginema sp. PMC 1080.18]MEC4849952.1 CHASE2 domain-containing protein [Jaaginema sp. PMC 1079.18]MEC4866146.1 CHASE2 domain-containing protein [Jaaginema sp. PMC 1078.18]
MDKLVTLKLKGTWENGFDITVKITDAEGQFLGEIEGKLPSNPDLLQQTINHWETEFRGIEKHDRIKPKRVVKIGSINERLQKCRNSATELQSQLNKWLKSQEFEPVVNLLREELNRQEETRFLIQSSNSNLQKLPWTEWEFLQKFNIEASIFPSKTESSGIRPLPKISQNPDHNKVKILAILGHSDGIDVEGDRETLESLPNSDITFLVEPQKWQINDQLWEQEWDIIFFAGHSDTESQDDRETGRLYLNSNQNIPPEERSITIDELWYGLKKATAKGLRLAIFNSCNGLGLTHILNDSLIPQAIVMREVVPDKIAQAFLLYFLKSFTQGATFYTAVQEARQRLTSVRLTYQKKPTETLEFECPCATWLPVICEHPAAIPPLWKDLYRKPEPPPPPPPPILINKPWWQGLPKVALTSGICTALVMGIRWLGMLQGIELMAFDTLLKLRPTEPIDERILVVEITEEDTNRYQYPLNDDILAELLRHLESFDPAIIGLNLHRYQAREEGRELLIRQFQKNPNLIGVCAYSLNDKNYEPPPELTKQQITAKMGFSDLAYDSPGESIRRQPLSYDLNQADTVSPCTTPVSFTWQIARRFLKLQGTKNIELNRDRNWQVDDYELKALNPRFGGYQNLGNNNQITINYRGGKPGQKVSLQDILDNKINPNQIEGKIVLVGNTSYVAYDKFPTPYGLLDTVWIQAYMISDIISAVQDNRPLIWAWPQGIDALWIFTWSLVGGWCVLLLKSRSLPQIILVCSLWVATLSAVSFLIFLQGGWLPLIPASLTLLAVSSITVCDRPQKVLSLQP